MSTEQRAAHGAALVVAELIGGPFDGHVEQLKPSRKTWPEFLDVLLGPEIPWDRREQREAQLKNPDGYLKSRRVQYRFEMLGNGTVRYVFDRRYNR